MTQDPNAPRQAGDPHPPAPQAYPGAPEPTAHPAAAAGYPTGAPAYPSGAPGYPAPGEGSAGPGPVTPPKPVALAVKLMYVGAVLSLLSLLSTFFFQEDLRAIVAAQPGMDSAAVDAAVTGILVVGVVFGLVGVGLWILNAVFNAKGKKWARILSTVLGAVAVLSTLSTFVQPTPAISVVLSIAQMLLAIGIIVLLWRPESSRFYEAASAPRYY